MLDSPRAFSSEAATGSRQENASNQESGAPFRFNRNGKGSRVRLLPVLGLLLAGYLLISPRAAGAQSIDRDSKWTVIDVTSAINRAIEASKGGVELREKVVRRFSECSLMYGALLRLASNAEAKKNYYLAQESTLEVQAAIAQPLPLEREREIEDAAKKSVAKMLDELKKHDQKELAPFLRNCKSLNDLKEIDNALRKLSVQ
jgi:hypothetical protein